LLYDFLVRFVLKIWGLATLVISFIIIGNTFRLLLIWNESLMRKASARLLQWASKIAIWILGIKIKRPDDSLVNWNSLPQFGLIVSNHLSYLDVVVISSSVKCIFITSEEIRESGFLGWITLGGGSYFVERRNAHRLKQELRELTALLKAGHRIAIFPEATSSDGRAILNFKRALFKIGEMARVPVLPICINYSKLDGTVMDRERADRFFYYRDMSFIENIIYVLKRREIEVELRLFEPIESGDSEASLHERCFEQVSNFYRPIL